MSVTDVSQAQDDLFSQPMFLQRAADPRYAGLHDQVGIKAVSSPEWCANPQRTRLNLLMCSKRVPADSPRTWEVVLDQADELEFLSLCGCQFIHVGERSKLRRKLGHVSPEGRRAIKRKLIEVYRLQS